MRVIPDMPRQESVNDLHILIARLSVKRIASGDALAAHGQESHVMTPLRARKGEKDQSFTLGGF